MLGHALYLKAIHGGKVKNDKLDSEKLAPPLRGGNFAIAYAYLKELRATRPQHKHGYTAPKWVCQFTIDGRPDN